jgi:hypothetical protein
VDGKVDQGIEMTFAGKERCMHDAAHVISSETEIAPLSVFLSAALALAAGESKMGWIEERTEVLSGTRVPTCGAGDDGEAQLPGEGELGENITGSGPPPQTSVLLGLNVEPWNGALS